jgi:uncharacterized protein YdbL (DUF1318 family)
MLRQLRSLAAAAALATLAGAALVGAPASAGPALDAAKASCEIAETVEGYLEAVPGAAPSAQARAEMNEVNNGRRAVYMETARSNGVDLAVVARLTGERQIEAAAAEGRCYRDDAGWKAPG